MGYWFTGTSTGNVYEVGRSYTMAGDTYTANWDGTFTNNRTGNSLVGSSQDDRVTFGYTGSLTGSGSGSAGTVGPGSAIYAFSDTPTTRLKMRWLILLGFLLFLTAMVADDQNKAFENVSSTAKIGERLGGGVS